MRREERVTVQGPVKEQQPDGMSHRGRGGGGGACPSATVPPLCRSSTARPAVPGKWTEGDTHPLRTPAAHAPRRRVPGLTRGALPGTHAPRGAPRCSNDGSECMARGMGMHCGGGGKRGARCQAATARAENALRQTCRLSQGFSAFYGVNERFWVVGVVSFRCVLFHERHPGGRLRGLHLGACTSALQVSWHALQSTRPFYIEDVVLANEGTILDKTLKDVKGFLMEKVDYFVQKCHDDRTFPPALLKTNPSLPLPMVRLRVDYSGGYPEVSPLQFGREYTTKVANATEILHPMKARKAPGQAVKGEGAVPYKKAEQQVGWGLW